MPVSVFVVPSWTLRAECRRYGPEYADPGQLGRLRSRSLGRKRSLAIREFALGAEA